MLHKPRFVGTWQRQFTMMGLLLVFLISVGSPVVAQNIPLAPPVFHVRVTSLTGGIYEYELDQTDIFPFTARTGDVPGPNGSSFNVTAGFTGGLAPVAHISGYGFGGDPTRTALGSALAELGYAVRPVALPAWAPAIANLPVPVTVSGHWESILQPLPAVGGFGGFASAGVELTGPGVSIIEGGQANPVQGLAFTGSFSHNISMYVGGRVNVYTLVRGNATNGEFSAMADPLFEIDPLATFDFNGEAIRFADAVELEYSPGILVPEPTSAHTFMTGLAILSVTLASGRRRVMGIKRWATL